MRYVAPAPRTLALISLLLGLAVCGASAAEQEAFPHLSRTVNTSRPAMVIVRTVREGPDGEERAVAQNTGFFVSEDGEVVTSLYVWVKKGTMEVVASGGRRSEARLEGVDQHTGLALLKTDLDDTPYLKPASSPPESGDWVVSAVARSNQGEDKLRVLYTPGRLSTTRTKRRICGVKWKDLLAIDVPVLKGGAAAPVLDEHGALVGVILAAEVSQDGVRTALALGGDRFKECLKVMREGGRRTGWLGVVLTCCDDENPGARVEAVLPGSPADAAGLQRGDRLLSVDKKKVDCAGVLERNVVRKEPGTTVELSIRRDGKTETVEIDIQARPLQIPE